MNKKRHAVRCQKGMNTVVVLRCWWQRNLINTSHLPNAQRFLLDANKLPGLDHWDVQPTARKQARGIWSWPKANGQTLLTVFPKPTSKTLNDVQGMARGERMHAAIARQRKIIAKDERVEQETLPAMPNPWWIYKMCLGNNVTNNKALPSLVTVTLLLSCCL